MKKFRNGILTLSFAFIMVMALGVVNVNAADYDLATEMGNLLAGNPLTLTAEDSLSYNNEVWFGANGRFTINSGEVTSNILVELLILLLIQQLVIVM